MASIKMPEGEIRARYDALPAFPSAPGERKWYDRMRSFEDFLRAAPAFVDWMGGAFDADVARCRANAPQLFRLAFDACDVPVPPVRAAGSREG
jgi:hypothetical protein